MHANAIVQTGLSNFAASDLQHLRADVADDCGGVCIRRRDEAHGDVAGAAGNVKQPEWLVAFGRVDHR